MLGLGLLHVSARVVEVAVPTLKLQPPAVALSDRPQLRNSARQSESIPFSVLSFLPTIPPEETLGHGFGETTARDGAQDAVRENRADKQTTRSLRRPDISRLPHNALSRWTLYPFEALKTGGI